MKCGFRSQAVGVKSRRSGDSEVVISERSMTRQWTPCHINRRDLRFNIQKSSDREPSSASLIPPTSPSYSVWMVSSCPRYLGPLSSAVPNGFPLGLLGGVLEHHGLADTVTMKTKAFERDLEGLEKVAPRAGLEPATSRLTAGCSTN